MRLDTHTVGVFQAESDQTDFLEVMMIDSYLVGIFVVVAVVFVLFQLVLLQHDEHWLAQNQFLQ